MYGPEEEAVQPLGDASQLTGAEQMQLLLRQGSYTHRVRRHGAMWDREVRLAPPRQDPAEPPPGVHVPLGSQRDEGTPGRFYGSHAEQQTHHAAPGAPVGVSRPMCEVCQNFFTSEAVRMKRTLTVADPDCVRLFQADGTVKVR
jgi:hypothetical protein